MRILRLLMLISMFAAVPTLFAANGENIDDNNFFETDLDRGGEDEFFRRERDILGGDPGGKEDYECHSCRYERHYDAAGRPYILRVRPVVRYTPRPADRQYRIIKAPTHFQWDPALSDSARYIFVE